MVIVLKKGSDKQRIQEVLQEIASRPAKRGLDTGKYSGTVKFSEDGVAYQKRMRDEWE